LISCASIVVGEVKRAKSTTIPDVVFNFFIVCSSSFLDCCITAARVTGRRQSFELFINERVTIKL